MTAISATRIAVSRTARGGPSGSVCTGLLSSLGPKRTGWERSAMDGDLSLAELGEFPMIDRIVAGRRQPAGVLLGPGDDAAVVSAPDARVAVSTDMLLVEGRHFRLDWSSPHDLGRKAIAQNAADIEAMGASVTSFVVAFGARHNTGGTSTGTG